MHCLIACAPGLTPGPRLTRLLTQWSRLSTEVGGEAEALYTPFERVVAHLRGVPEPSPAGWLASERGLHGQGPWAVLSPLHLELDAQQAHAHALPALSSEDAHALLAVIAPLFTEGAGWRLEPLGQGEFLVGHAQLADLRVASLERIQHRALTPWLPQERWLRRLQNEIQMSLHQHPINQSRIERGDQAIHSLWMWGVSPEVGSPAPLPPEARLWVDPCPGDELDAGPIAELESAWRAGQTVQLTLAGGARAHSWIPGSAWRRGLARLGWPQRPATWAQSQVEALEVHNP
ncbi:hypothetical protein [Inhella gelatinilytica]|uniref:Cofactor-independent phosphoglycerate mutase n=1 Tax=Inhella gelatinilytica TaxID=2795030 RepID=A0A931NEN3_9BURK|nr:hypothetical protein [Inhella gelatinilytica]MBH9552696.1 hypothetical protein [Inhella gelatinilytica]